MKSNIVDVPGELQGDSASGLAYRFYDGNKVVWLPKSYCEWDPDAKTMAMPVWLAQSKELV